MKLLVVDDHPVLREGLATLLRQIEPDTLVLEAGDAEAGLALVAVHSDFDVVILDIVLPGLDGLRAIAEFGRVRPELPVIVLSSSEDAATVRQALAQGALGFVPKSASRHTLISAIRLVASGELYVPALVLNDAPASRAAPGGLDAAILAAAADRTPDRGAQADERRADQYRHRQRIGPVGEDREGACHGDLQTP